MSLVRIIYLGLAIIGAILPMSYFIAWFRENGVSWDGLVTAWTANAASTGIMWDLTIAALALTFWSLVEV